MKTEIKKAEDTIGVITYTPHDLGWVRCTDRLLTKYEHTIKTLEIILTSHRDSKIQVDWNNGKIFFTYYDQKDFGMVKKINGGFNLTDSVLIWEKELGL